MATVRNWSQRTGRVVLALAAVVCLSAACADQAPSAGAPSSPPSPAAVLPSDSGSPRADLVVGGDRPVTVHLPASSDANQPAPLLILLHGYTSSGRDGDAYFNLARAAHERGFVYAFPDGTIDSDGNRFWNATDTCCDFDDSGVDDIGYLAGVIAEIQANVAVDPMRIYVLGHSNGGFMAHRLACDEGELVAAIVSLAGATYADPADCAPSAPVSIVQIHGTADDTVDYEGGRLSDFDGSSAPPYPGAEATAEAWAEYDGCEEASTQLNAKVDVDAELASGTDPAETSVAEWAGCTSGATVQLWTIPGGGHAPSISTSFADTILGFLLDHPKP